jgi:uncharacterized protein YbjT (DUF2867 family)
MPRVLITGGRGGLGSQLSPGFAEAGWPVRIGSRGPRPEDLDSKYEWAQYDLVKGVGLEDALAGVDLVVHAASDTPTGRKDPRMTRTLCRAAHAAGIPHLFYISIVGIDRIPLPYYKRKLACERAIEDSGVPWSNLRAVQFHSLIDYFLSILWRTPLVLPLPRRFKFQSMDTGEVAAHILEQAQKGPSGRLPDLAGPQVLTIDEMARTWMRARGRRKPVAPMPVFGKIARGFRRGYNCDPDHPQGEITWHQWIARKYAGKP